ncbi:16S rRNA (cytosine(967)-C(5))-methyltransferase RsmB [Nitrosospira sp. Is2]|uniref:16S rRNA (cytosine(967)-C(5))-methyltransferase RsmB n=1 Tax=Nitrosospira sp. Is2 TaxID=3080532 RepID=UPI002955303D|nr:16S rRNA (cytosine(967)-C(5))-methyltransferase RsmB [Nitrosospira sp. Is2]WON74952.1 16S rRNA (cytosine(967)-C(5))-methyltransferase RsmB [Nitrosospira sp. Is2]
MIKTQRLAAATVGRVLGGASLTAVLQDLWHNHADLTEQQRGAIQDLSYGVLRFYGQLHAILGLLLKKPLKNKDIIYLLLVALYQLEYSKAAPHAVVDNAVSASQGAHGSTGLQGLVNAVLRNFLRQHSTLLQESSESEVGRYSHPQWWIDKLRIQYPERYQAVLEASNLRPSMTLRINRRKTTVAEYLERLSQSNMSARLAGEDALELEQPVPVEKLPGFGEGLVSVQDAGAQLAAKLLEVSDNDRVLDACAAPGGKSAHLLELAEVDLTVLDSDNNRLARVTRNFSRLGLKAHRVIHSDASQPAQWWDGNQFDRILADVPCSASGVTRRHPDIKWLRRESDLSQFAAKQREILEALWPMLSRGGKLLYVTCSVFTEENGLQVEEFLRRHADARTLPLSRAEITDGQLLPDSHHDGFFYALVLKV